MLTAPTKMFLSLSKQNKVVSGTQPSLVSSYVSRFFGKKENVVIADKLKRVFAEWIDNGHNNFDDENTIILCHLNSGEC